MMTPESIMITLEVEGVVYDLEVRSAKMEEGILVIEIDPDSIPKASGVFYD